MLIRFIIILVSVTFLMIGCGADSTINNATRTRTPTLTPTVPTVEKVELSEAESKGLVKVSILGKETLEYVQLSLESTSGDPLEIKITPGTIFKASSGSTQDMVVREERTIQLKSRGSKESLAIETACANMKKDPPTGNDTFSISQTAAPEDLKKLLALPGFRNQEFNLQQFAIWTITDNPGKDEYLSESDLLSIKQMFQLAGISTGKYQALQYLGEIR